MIELLHSRKDAMTSYVGTVIVSPRIIHNLTMKKHIHFHTEYRQLLSPNENWWESNWKVKILGVFELKKHCNGVSSSITSVRYLTRCLEWKATYYAWDSRQVESGLRYGLVFCGSSSKFKDVLFTQRKVFGSNVGVSQTNSCEKYYEEWRFM